ncbi:uncharacterized protein LOC127420121 isoform X2 [Myxocyprinus asiaticus]|uniref:uncharacterized protein LOC127420121 isoform X2 n=1 Tax=Myxocyprinus asiaticus TaxID=70543 RepID=UPI00222299CD|nr:uncharacterized protein LOC127420121 isoform X2 [Myxocyprinus asiaticus]
MAERIFVFADEEELFSLMKDMDCLYCRNPVPASKHHLERRHLKFAIYYKDADIGKFSIPCYCADGGHGRSHWHCPMCTKTLQRTQDYRHHISKHGVKMIKNKTEQERHNPCRKKESKKKLSRGFPSYAEELCMPLDTNTPKAKAQERHSPCRKEESKAKKARGLPSYAEELCMPPHMKERIFVFADEEELFSLMKDMDCLYCRNPVPASKHHLERRHLKFAIYYKDADIGKFSIPCYCADGGHGRSHWHCPMCTKTLQRTQDYRHHISKHGVEMTHNPADKIHNYHKKLQSDFDAQEASVILRDKDVCTFEHDNFGEPTAFLFETLQTDNEDDTPDNEDDTPDNEDDTPDIEDDMPDKKLTCQTCGFLFTNLSNLRRHERLQHGQVQQPMFCIDAKNGIYVTPKDLHGPRVPIHILKSFTLQIMLCELEECREFMIAQAQCGNPGKECCHLERTSHARKYVPPPPLCLNSLEEMTNKGLLSKLEKQECQEMNSMACLEGVDCVYPVHWGEFELLDKYIYFSVYTNLKDTWCQFGRTRVSFDHRSRKWKCLCEHTKNSCIHKYLSMWWMFQERPELFYNNLDTNPETADLIEEVIVELNDRHQDINQYNLLNRPQCTAILHSLVSNHKKIKYCVYHD